jgi:hypothetical protein
MLHFVARSRYSPVETKQRLFMADLTSFSALMLGFKRPAAPSVLAHDAMQQLNKNPKKLQIPIQMKQKSYLW